MFGPVPIPTPSHTRPTELLAIEDKVFSSIGKQAILVHREGLIKLWWADGLFTAGGESGQGLDISSQHHHAYYYIIYNTVISE